MKTFLYLKLANLSPLVENQTLLGLNQADSFPLNKNFLSY